MFSNYLTRNLKEGEVAIREVRRYPWSFAGQAILAALFLLSPFFFLFPLLRLGRFGVVAFFILLVLGLLIVLRMLLLYFFNVLFITNLRLIDVDQRGFFNQVVSETTYEKIQDVSYTVKGLWPTLMHYGTVQIQTAGAQANLEIHKVHNPERVHELIMKVQAELRSATTNGDLSAQELVAIVNRLKQGLGEEAFQRLAGRQRPTSGEKRKPSKQGGE